MNIFYPDRLKCNFADRFSMVIAGQSLSLSEERRTGNLTYPSG